MSKQVVILAAGMGTRLARPLPKPLTELRDGRSIMKQQIDNLKTAFGESYRVMIVVGFKLEAIIERFPEATFVYNEFFDQTNTSKSLLKALRSLLSISRRLAMKRLSTPSMTRVLLPNFQSRLSAASAKPSASTLLPAKTRLR